MIICRIVELDSPVPNNTSSEARTKIIETQMKALRDDIGNHPAMFIVQGQPVTPAVITHLISIDDEIQEQLFDLKDAEPKPITIKQEEAQYPFPFNVTTGPK